MDKNATPLKTKPPPSSSSEEESGSSHEETEDEEQAEGGSGFESGSDESTDTTKKKLVSILPTKQLSTVKAAAPAAAAGSPAKRTREANGKKEKVDEPPPKKKKPEVATPAPKAAPKPTALQSDKKSAAKTEKSKPTPAAKAKPSKETSKSSTKRKTLSPASAKPSGSRSEDETPQKGQIFSRPWSPDEEFALARELQKDRVDDVYGASLPTSRSDPYWEKLMSRLNFMKKYEKSQRIERLCEKVRRMRLRYEALNTRLKAGETSVYKNVHEGVLWRIWHTIWGPNKATPEMLNRGDDDDDDEEEEEDEDESDDGSDEDDAEEIVPTQVKGRQSTVSRAPAQKKAPSKKAVASDDDDESDKEDSPVEATPPAVLAAPAVQAIPAAAAPSVAGKHAVASKSVPAKGPGPTAMDVDSGKNSAQRVAEHNGGQGGHAGMSTMIEKSVRTEDLPKVSDEMRAENLALLRDMRGTCVKMVEEAKVQSLLVTEKILGETRAKTTQIVEEARVKSAQIFEELRLVVERLGTIAGQSGHTNGSHVGRWSDLPENPFQGMGLLGDGAVPSGEATNLNVKWREQNEAEQGLLLQRLQLVQEQARIQQEGIRLKLSLQKQQSLGQEKQALGSGI